ncbi:MAG: hypothetical protein ABR608_09970 [Pseudonocardiaceae bacterium]
MKTLLTRLRARPFPSLVAVLALLLAAGFGVLAWVVTDNADTGEVVNTAGGYRIEIPEGWSATQDGRTTKVTSPEKDTLITFGLGRTGPLPVAATLFFQQVGSNYRDVQVFAPDAKKVGPRNALAYGGVGTNKQNAKVRFLAITVENTPTNFGITVFTEANTDPTTTLPAINQIVDSFRTLPPS